jgi:hypothetical protein
LDFFLVIGFALVFVVEGFIQFGPKQSEAARTALVGPVAPPALASLQAATRAPASAVAQTAAQKKIKKAVASVRPKKSRPSRRI